MIGKIISHYKILEKLGEGGMGVVYKARDTKLKRTVALKFLPQELLCDSEAKARFVHEAQAASALNHPNITTIHEIDEVEGECFISMEYIEGQSIKELVKGKGLSIEEILKIAIQIAEGLSKAHQKDIVHRDIKSDNIIITHDDLAKIMDFGLAKLKGVTKLTKTGSILGTLQYMSPEQAQGKEVDHRSDIFSFGVVLYEMITGQLPFKGEHEAAVIYSIVNETAEPLARYKANVPEGLQRMVDKALKKDRSTRYQSAADIIADIKRLQKEMMTCIVMTEKPPCPDFDSMLIDISKIKLEIDRDKELFELIRLALKSGKPEYALRAAEKLSLGIYREDTYKKAFDCYVSMKKFAEAAEIANKFSLSINRDAALKTILDAKRKAWRKSPLKN